MKEILILIEDYRDNKESDKESVDVFTDFRSKQDHIAFLDLINHNTENKASAFVIKGIKHSKRIAIGKYYRLDVNTITNNKNIGIAPKNEEYCHPDVVAKASNDPINPPL